MSPSIQRNHLSRNTLQHRGTPVTPESIIRAAPGEFYLKISTYGAKVKFWAEEMEPDGAESKPEQATETIAPWREAKHKPIRTAPDYRPYDGSNVEGDVDNIDFGENKGEGVPKIGAGIGLGPETGFGPVRQSNPPKGFRPGTRQPSRGQAK